MSGRVGLVVIGRNEGARLTKALSSARICGYPLVYVDSGSTDGSPHRARDSADAVIELDPARPFNAARARNSGLAELLRRWPDTLYAMFLDGDCILLPDFPGAAARALDEVPNRSVVIGHLQELAPEASVYNRLCGLEWRSPAGDLTNYGALGGIMMARIAHVIAIGGFNEDMIAGEDSELGVRLGLAGRTVTKIDVPMAVHDADIHSFSQWWRRSVRAGHALADRFHRNRTTPARDCEREYRSTLILGMAVPIAILAAFPFEPMLSAVLLAGYAALGVRMFLSARRRGCGRRDALLLAGFGICAKLANAVGLVRYALQKRRGGGFRILEYK